MLDHTTIRKKIRLIETAELQDAVTLCAGRTRGRARLWFALIILGSLCVSLIGNNLVSLWDRDEAWYAQIAREMLQSRPANWVVPRFQGKDFQGKPVFAFWCQAAAMAVLGDNAFAARLPSAIAMTATLIILASCIARVIGTRRAMWTVFILASSALPMISAKMCLTDSILLLWITIVELCLYGIYIGKRSWLLPIAMCIATGLAILTKGPVVLGVLGMTLFTLAALDVGGQWKSPRAWLESCRWWLRARPIVGVIIVACVVAPWAFLIHRQAPEFLKTSLIENILIPITSTPLEGHKGPPGYYLATVWPSFFPWSIFIPLALVCGWTYRKLPANRFALAAVVGPWLVLEIVHQKLPHYLLPIMPALAYLTADGIIRCLRGQRRDFATLNYSIAMSIWLAVAIVISLAPWIPAWPRFGFGDLPWLIMCITSVIGIAYALLVWRQFLTRQFRAALITMGVGMMLIVTLFHFAYLPRASYLHLSQDVASVLVQHGATHPGDAVSIGYSEPSLVFYQGGTIRLEKKSPALQLPAAEPWVVITKQFWEASKSSARDEYRIVQTFRGWGYNAGGRIIDLIVAQRRPGVASGGERPH